jgi:hypothetical protein
MSSGLCKKLEGAVFPFQVESLEDGVNDAVHAGDIDEADDGPSSSANFHETKFDDVAGAHLRVTSYFPCSRFISSNHPVTTLI